MLGLRESCHSWDVIPSFSLSPEVFPTLALLSLAFLKLCGKNRKISLLYKSRIEITYPVLTVVYCRGLKFVLQ